MAFARLHILAGPLPRSLVNLKQLHTIGICGNLWSNDPKADVIDHMMKRNGDLFSDLPLATVDDELAELLAEDAAEATAAAARSGSGGASMEGAAGAAAETKDEEDEEAPLVGLPRDYWLEPAIRGAHERSVPPPLYSAPFRVAFLFLSAWYMVPTPVR